MELLVAALHGKCNLLRKLLEKPGVDVNATAEYKTKDGEAVQTTSLLAAVRNSQQEAVELLLDRPWRRMMISRLLRRMTMTLKTSESTSEMGLSCARQCKSGWATHLIREGTPQNKGPRFATSGELNTYVAKYSSRVGHAVRTRPTPPKTRVKVC